MKTRLYSVQRIHPLGNGTNNNYTECNILSEGNKMADLLYVGLTLVFLVASWGFILVCEKLMEDKG
jgi:hypothetical protein